MQRSTLELRWRTRAGGGGVTERRYLDFVVDGVSLQDQLRPGDQVTGLGCWVPAAERDSIQQLLLRAAPESPSGRVPLYVCAECGGLSCGAITMFVERAPEGFVWRDFAYENDYDGLVRDRDLYRDIGPFLFNKTDYWRVFHQRESEIPLA